MDFLSGAWASKMRKIKKFGTLHKVSVFFLNVTLQTATMKGERKRMVARPERGSGGGEQPTGQRVDGDAFFTRGREKSAGIRTLRGKSGRGQVPFWQDRQILLCHILYGRKISEPEKRDSRQTGTASFIVRKGAGWTVLVPVGFGFLF